MYILFYSTHCAFSRQFLSTLDRTEEKAFFKRFSVDTKESKHIARTKYKIQKVPTIIVNEQKLEGVDALKWLQQKIKRASTGVSSMGTRQNKAPCLPQVQPMSDDLPNAVLGGGAIAGVGNYCDVFQHPSITTPSEDDTYEKPKFIMSSDSITRGEHIPKKTSESDKMSDFEARLQKLQQFRQ